MSLTAALMTIAASAASGKTASSGGSVHLLRAVVEGLGDAQ
jgi:hypothetical protein